MRYLLIIFILSSCSNNIKHFSDFKKAPILKSEFLDIEEVKQGGKVRVVVFPFDEGDNALAKRLDLGKSLAVTLETILVQSKQVIVKDRKAFKDLEKEISLIEINQPNSYEGIKEADYAIRGEISNSGFTHQFVSASSYFDGKNYISIPAKNIYSSNFQGSIKIYKLPSLEVQALIELSDTEKRSENAITKGFLFNKKVDQSSIKTSDDVLVRNAAIESIEKKKSALKNMLSNLRKAYIIDKKSLGKKNVFKISLGNLDAIKKGQKLNIFSKSKNSNLLTGEEEVEERMLGTAKISNIISDKYAWIRVKDKKIAKQIKLGDRVQIIYKRTFSEFVKSF